MNRQLPELLSIIALLIVAVLVLGGVLRLVLTDWNYVFLIGAVLAAAFYVFSQMQQKRP